MYSTFAINHHGNSYLPEGKIKPKHSPMLDCGHPRPPVEKGAFTSSWGYVHTATGNEEYCLDCCFNIEKEALKTVPAYSAYFDEKKRTITTWTGYLLMHILHYKIYHPHRPGHLSFRMIALTAKDIYGKLWHGRTSYDNGNIVNLHRSKGQIK